jgi:hypothetical protein
MLSITLKHMEHALIIERFFLTLTQAETASLLGNLILECASEANKLQRNAYSRASNDLPIHESQEYISTSNHL